VVRPALHSGELAQRMIGAFIACDVAQPTQTNASGASTIKSTQPTKSGMPGMILPRSRSSTARMRITDWKTACSRWTAEQADEGTEQLLLYSELAGDFAPGKPVRLQFAVLTKTVAIDRHTRAVDQQRLERIKLVVERVWRAIEAKHFYPAPSPMNCTGCPFREPCHAWRD
jgi:putative RecB family exonuclease